MSSARRLFQWQTEGEVLILSPTANLSELELSYSAAEFRTALQEIEDAGYRHVVLDFTGTDYYGSTALGFFVKLWKRVSKIDGGMAFCNVSAHEREVLHVTRLDTLWPICGTRQQAIAQLQQVERGVRRLPPRAEPPHATD